MEKLFDEENSTYSPLLHLCFKAWSGEENPKLLLLQLKATIGCRCLTSPKACLFLITHRIFCLLSSKSERILLGQNAVMLTKSATLCVFQQLIGLA